MTQERLWWCDGIIYQIYPRSFQDSNDDGIGDLPGITARLGYLADLGIDAIWLSPIYPSPDVDFGYDISDYTGIDPKFGTQQDFDCLVEEAHNLGIRVIMDLVLNHTSDQHPWFIESRSSLDNPKRDWYLWQPPGPGNSRPNNWQSVFGGPGWEYDPTTRQYYFHMFYKQQPDLNWRNPEVRQAMLDVFRFWLERGVDGFRLDVFNAYFKDPKFRSNPAVIGLRGFDRQRHVYDTDQPDMLPLLEEVRQLLDRYPDRYAVGETFLDHNPQAAAGYCGDQRLHAAFNFTFLESQWSPLQFLNSIQSWEKALGGCAWPNYVLSNHDVHRTATRYCQGEDDARAYVAAALLLTQRGTPFLYYGEEIGMRDIRLSRSQILDPVGKRFWPFYPGRDGCRSPMQWDDSPQSGFTTSTPWLPLHANAHKRNVERQLQDPGSLLNFFKKLVAIRRASSALLQGSFTPVQTGNRSVMAYTRDLPDESVFVALNFSASPQQVSLPPELAQKHWNLMLSTHLQDENQPLDKTLLLRGSEARLLSGHVSS